MFFIIYFEMTKFFIILAHNFFKKRLCKTFFLEVSLPIKTKMTKVSNRLAIFALNNRYLLCG